MGGSMGNSDKSMNGAGSRTESNVSAPVGDQSKSGMTKDDTSNGKSGTSKDNDKMAAGGDSGHAEATIKMLGENGATVGTITFDQQGKQVTMKGTFTGLKPGKHGFHIHEKGDCGGKDAKNAGMHFNPSNSKHGPPESGTRHAGDFGNITADKDGNASFEMTTDSLTVAPGVDSIANRAIVIHAKADNGKTQPSGGSGTPIACGVIEVK